MMQCTQTWPDVAARWETRHGVTEPRWAAVVCAELLFHVGDDQRSVSLETREVAAQRASVAEWGGGMRLSHGLKRAARRCSSAAGRSPRRSTRAPRTLLSCRRRRPVRCLR